MDSKDSKLRDNESLVKPCPHYEKKCVQCEQVFATNDTVDKRRALYSGTYYGTYTKSIDKRDESSGVCENSGTSKWVIPGQRAHMVKYSVNGVLKGQTRFSYSFDEDDKCYTRRIVKKQTAIDDHSFKEDKKEDSLDEQNKKKQSPTISTDDRLHSHQVKTSSVKLAAILKKKKVSMRLKKTVSGFYLASNYTTFTN